MTAAVLAAVSGATAVLVLGARPTASRVRRREPVDVRPSAPRRTGARLGGLLLAVALLGAVVVVGPALSLVAVAAVALARADRVRRARSRDLRARDDAFPDLVDLFRIAAAAGHPVHRCLELVAVRAPAPVRGSLGVARTLVRRGVPLAEALGALGPELGRSGPVLTDALQASLRTGSPLGPVLDRVVLVARDRRVRAAQTAARRLPVTMLFPLVCCVLPAFGLLGVVPLLAGSLGSLAP